jgi:hypothetical protein
MTRWLLWSLILVASNLPGQIVEATGCVHKVGDDPAWARADFNDRDWQTDLPPITNSYSWTRCRLDLRSLPAGAKWQINVGAMGAWELFVDGARIAVNGDIGSGFARNNSFYLDPLQVDVGHLGEVRVALRRQQFVWPPTAVGVRLQAGTRESISGSNAAALVEVTVERLPAVVFGTLTLFAGLVLLILFRADQSRKELLWFGVLCLSLAMNRLLNAPFTTLPYGLFLAVISGANILFFTSLPAFFFTLADKPLPRAFHWIRIVAVANITLVTILIAAQMPQRQQWLNTLILAQLFLQFAIVLAPAFAFWPYATQRLLAGLSLLWMAGGLANAIAQMPGFPQSAVSVARNFQAWASAPAVIAIFVLIASRYRRISLDRAELQNEMLAAQEVQRLLTSSTLDVAAWATVDVSYLPAKQVGGDFYFCRQTPEGQLIVVGDVSGKGLRAAMLASVALGAIRNSARWSPGALMQDLNAALHGQTGGGFVTCCAALLRKDGQLIVSNAGHPAPYVDGNEFAVEAGLPLGIVVDADYAESIGQAEGVTLVSDGVVEAENAQRELFGFERTRVISGKSAQEIAEAARVWGQTDDITVVKVWRKS